VGWIWANLRTLVFRLQEYKAYEIALQGRAPLRIPVHPGTADPRVPQYD
jgi:hypothetical protein